MESQPEMVAAEVAALAFGLDAQTTSIWSETASVELVETSLWLEMVLVELLVETQKVSSGALKVTGRAGATFFGGTGEEAVALLQLDVLEA